MPLTFPFATSFEPLEGHSAHPVSTAEAAAAALDAFAQSEWGRKFPTVAAMWQRQWEQVIPFFAYPPEVRRIVYTTNAIESMHMQLRKIVKNRGHFPNEAAAMKCLYLTTRSLDPTGHGKARWVVRWKPALNAFAITFAGRFERTTH